MLHQKDVQVLAGEFCAFPLSTKEILNIQSIIAIKCINFTKIAASGKPSYKYLLEIAVNLNSFNLDKWWFACGHFYPKIRYLEIGQ